MNIFLRIIPKLIPFMCILILIIATGCKTTFGKNDNKLSFVCYNDISSDFRVELPPVLGEMDFVEKMNDFIIGLHRRWVERISSSGLLTSKQIDVLQNLSLVVDFNRNSLGKVEGNLITLNEGYLLVGYAMAYSNAKLLNNNVDTEVFNLWQNYFFDSIIMNDPIVYIDGVRNFQNFIFSSGGFDEKLHDEFVARLNGWVALTLFHEAAHLLYDHEAKMKNAFPTTYFQSPENWSAEQLKFNRLLELEADRAALDLYMKGCGYDPYQILLPWIDWQLARSAAISKGPYIIYPTHPNTKDRARNIFTHYCEIKEISISDRNSIVDDVFSYIDYQEGRLNAGILEPVPKLKGQRPASISPNLERFLIRDQQLLLKSKN